MSDYLEIQSLVYRYASAADERDYERFRDVFTPDAELVMPEATLSGCDAIVSAMAALEQFKRTLHMVSNLEVDVQGDGGSAQCYCIGSHIFDGEGGEWKLDWGIRYLDQLRRTPEGWRIARRVLERVWEQSQPLTQGGLPS